jgi:hypothetical protein
LRERRPDRGGAVAARGCRGGAVAVRGGRYGYRGAGPIATTATVSVRRQWARLRSAQRGAYNRGGCGYDAYGNGLAQPMVVIGIGTMIMSPVATVPSPARGLVQVELARRVISLRFGTWSLWGA